jgi:hypothetical protein
MPELEKSLGKLAEQINNEHRACEEAVNSALAHAINAGELLSEAKKGLPHGSWAAWLAENFEGSGRTAQAYMRLYRRRDEIRNGAADLSIRGALAELTAPKELTTEERPGFNLAELEARAEAALVRFESGAKGTAEAHEAWEGIARDYGLSARAISAKREKRLGWLREAAIGLHALSDEEPFGGGIFDQSVDRLENDVRPVDVPPSRERGALEDMLTYRQMHQTIGELRHSGILPFPEE